MWLDVRFSNYFSLSALVTGVSYFICALFALHLTDGIATVWPASGIAIAGLLLAPKSAKASTLLAIAAASLASNMLIGSSFLQSAAFTLANSAEAVIGYFCIRHINRHSDTVYNPVSVLEFCVAAILTGTLSASISALLNGNGLDLTFVSWVTTVSLGIMIVVPLVLNIVRGIPKLHTIQRTEWLTYSVILLLVGAISYAAFAQNEYPLLFIPLMCVIVATYLIGPNGAMISILIIAVIGSSTILGGNSLYAMDRNDEVTATLFLQFYFFVLLLSALPLAALLAARDRVLTQVTRAKRWLEMSEQFANVGHWRLDLKKEELFWSDEVYRIHGLVPGDAQNLEEAINFYHPDDRARIELSLETLVATGEPFDIQARLFTTKGVERHVRSRGELERDTDGNMTAIFGIFQDVTEQAQAALRLSDARRFAEEQADYAMVLAQTDPLTGIPNRRNTLDMLERELQKARENATQLSVAILDIDHFKSINDQFGHTVGDSVIRKIATVCVTAIRSSDFAGRIGGEEFVIILPGSDAETAIRVGERVRQTIEATHWPQPGPEQVTASIGLATLNSAISAEDLLGEADKALYRAKREGRNLLRAA